MSELSSEARALVSDGRGMLRPSRDDRARIASRLAQRLGVVTLLSAQPSFAATKASGASLFSSIVAGLGLLAAGATYSLSRPADMPPAPVTPAMAGGISASPSVAQPCTATPPLPVEAESVDAPAVSPAARKASTNDRLGEEVALLSRATSQLRGGNAAAALELLEQHRRQFPSGRLVEERRAARAQALCALGDRGGAQVELARLASSAPRSPHVVRAQRACGL